MRFDACTWGSAACRGFLLALAGSVALASGDGAPTADPALAREDRRWLETVAAGGTVRVVNLHGNVYARFGGYEDRVEILATIQRLASDRAPLEVAVAPSDSGLDVLVGPGGRPEPFETADRIDLVLFVPRGRRLDARTERGEIEVKGLQSDLAASTITGDVRIRDVRGHVRAKSVRGRISAVLETGVTSEAQELTTETGEIEVYLWEDADLDVRIATSGEIATDFSLEIEHRRSEEPGKHATARVGGGGRQLALYSRRGNVHLLRLQRDFTPEPRDRGHP